MKLYVVFSVIAFSSCCPLHAQDNPSSSVTSEQRKSVSDERAAETKANLTKGRARQESLDKRTGNIMARWSYAVCVGCGPKPEGFRSVHTHPLRVLAGIQAADDDARASSVGRRI